jgi:hypothetical protein
MISLTREFESALLCLNVRFNHKSSWNPRYFHARMAARGVLWIYISRLMWDINHWLQCNVNNINNEFWAAVMAKLMRTKRPSHCLCRMDTINLSIVLLRDFLATAYLALHATDPLPYWVFFNKEADANATLVHDDMTGIKWRFPPMEGNTRESTTCTEATQYSNRPEPSLRNGSDGSCHFYQLETGNTCTTDDA